MITDPKLVARQKLETALGGYELVRNRCIRMRLLLNLIDAFVPLYSAIERNVNLPGVYGYPKGKEKKAFIEDTILFINTGKRELRASLWTELMEQRTETAGIDKTNEAITMPPVNQFIKGFLRHENGDVELFEFIRAAYAVDLLT